MNPIMQNLPQLSAQPGQEGLLGEGRSQTVRQQSMEASMSQAVNLTLMTREGDRVTLSSSAVTDVQAMAYDRTGRLQGSDAQGAYAMSYRSITLSSGSQFTFSVKGDLSKEELDDIQKILGSLDDILGEMAGGNMDKAMATAMTMNGYGTVSRFEADLSLSNSFRAETRTQTQTQGRGRGRSGGSAMNGDTVRPLSGNGESFLDRMKRLLENRDAGFLKTLEAPVGQLFSEHLTPLEAANQVALDLFSDLIESLKAMQQEMMGILQQSSAA